MTLFGDTLTTRRQTRRLSQLDLALEAEVSARHISFLETGRARPSADMIRRLAEALNMPLAARNHMLQGAGFAARFPGRDWEDSAMAPVRAAVDHMLMGHMPWPGLALDRVWRIVRMNDAARLLFSEVGVGQGGSLLDLMRSPEMPRLVENWSEVAHHAAMRLRTESAAQGGVEELDATARFLSATPPPDTPTQSPVIPTILQLGETRLSLFATLAQFGTPEDLTLDDLKIELYFPADDATGAILRQMSAN